MPIATLSHDLKKGCKSWGMSNWLRSQTVAAYSRDVQICPTWHLLSLLRQWRTNGRRRLKYLSRQYFTWIRETFVVNTLRRYEAIRLKVSLQWQFEPPQLRPEIGVCRESEQRYLAPRRKGGQVEINSKLEIRISQQFRITKIAKQKQQPVRLRGSNFRLHETC